MSDIHISLQRYMGRPVQEVVDLVLNSGLKPMILKPGMYVNHVMVHDRVQITEENGVVTRIVHG